MKKKLTEKFEKDCQYCKYCLAILGNSACKLIDEIEIKGEKRLIIRYLYEKNHFHDCPDFEKEEKII